MTSIVAPEMADQEYTITTLPMEFTFPPFATEPAGCPVSYTFSTVVSGVVDSFSSEERKFVIFYRDDLIPSGITQKSYKVQVSGTAGTFESKGTST